MPRPGVSVVIIDFNSGKYIFKCLEHVRAQTYPGIETLVVDNASSDGSSEKLAEMARRGEIRYHRSDANLGSSKANNFGIRNTSGEFVLVLNADAFINPDYIERCVEAFASNPEVGTVVGKLVSPDDDSIIDCAGVMLFREGIALDRGMREKDVGQYDRPEFVAGACCAAALYSRRMLEAVRIADEYYDEDFFAFYEDVDLSVRALLLGWKTLYIPEAVARHVRGAWNVRASPFVEFLGRRNMHLFYLKTFENGDRVGAALRRLLYFAWTFTKTGALEREAGERMKVDVERLRGKLLEKRRLLAAGSDHERLRPFCRNSYIGQAIARRLKTILGRR